MPKVLEGEVVSTKMQKTVVVKVVRTFSHPKYKKVVSKSKRYKAHNEGFNLREGDLVLIQESRPISKDKHFRVIKKLEKK